MEKLFVVFIPIITTVFIVLANMRLNVFLIAINVFSAVLVAGVIILFVGMTAYRLFQH